MGGGSSIRIMFSVFMGFSSLLFTIYSSVIVGTYNFKSESFWVWDCFAVVYFGFLCLSCLYMPSDNNKTHLSISWILVFYNIALIIIGIIFLVNGKAKTLPCSYDDNIISYCYENELRKDD